MSYYICIFISDLLYLGVAALALVSIIIVLIASNEANYSEIAELKENWNYGPLVDVTTDINCKPENYLIKDEWPGTVQGCLKNSGVRRYACTRESRGDLIDEIAPIPIRYWRGSLLCAERVPSSYLDLIIVKNGDLCPIDHKPCGRIDSLNNILCFPSKDSCPFNDFKIVLDGDVIPVGNYLTIDADGANLQFSNEFTDQPIISQFQMHEKQPCANSYYKNYQITPYILEVYYDKDKCDKPDTNGDILDMTWERIDSYSIFNQYRDNGIFNKMGILQDYDAVYNEMLISNRKTGLYERNYMGVSIACHSYLQDLNKSNDVFVRIQYLTEDVKMIKILSLYSLIMLSVGILINLYFFLHIIFKKCCSVYDDKKSLCIRLKLGIFSFVFYLVSFCLNCVIVAKIFANLEIAKDIYQNADCLNENSLKGLIKTGESVDQIEAYSVIALVTTLFNFLVLAVSSIIIHCCCKPS